MGLTPWNAIIGKGGEESAGDDEAKRAFDAMTRMKRIDVAAIEAARRG